MNMAFDTLAAAKALKGAGFDEARADAIASVVRQSTELPNIDHLATKSDIDKLRLELKLFVASSVLGGAVILVLAQVILKFLGLAA
jgi:hypothetical protein